MNLRNATHAACDVLDVHDTLRTNFEEVSVSSAPQASATRVMTRALVPGAVGSICPALSALQRVIASAEWAPTMRAVGTYAAQAFMRLPLRACTTDGRAHPQGGLPDAGSAARSSPTISDTTLDARGLGQARSAL